MLPSNPYDRTLRNFFVCQEFCAMLSPFYIEQKPPWTSQLQNSWDYNMKDYFSIQLGNIALLSPQEYRKKLWNSVANLMCHYIFGPNAQPFTLLMIDEHNSHRPLFKIPESWWKETINNLLSNVSDIHILIGNLYQIMYLWECYVQFAIYKEWQKKWTLLINTFLECPSYDYLKRNYSKLLNKCKQPEFSDRVFNFKFFNGLPTRVIEMLESDDGSCRQFDPDPLDNTTMTELLEEYDVVEAPESEPGPDDSAIFQEYDIVEFPNLGEEDNDLLQGYVSDFGEFLPPPPNS